MSLTARGNGLHVRLALTGLSSDDVGVLAGTGKVPYVAVEDTGASVAGTTVVELPLMFSKVVSVVAEDNSGGSAVALGDKLYKDGSEINKDVTNGTFVAYALGVVTSGATSSIEVGFAPAGS